MDIFVKRSIPLGLAIVVLSIGMPAAAQDATVPPAQDAQAPALNPGGPMIPAATPQPPSKDAAANPPAPASRQPNASGTASGRVEVPSGTHIPLVLHNAVSTRSAKIGDPIYLETLFPVMVNGRVAIPAGSYVSGEVTETKRPGRVKGRAELAVRLNTLILPNGYMVSLAAVPNNAGTGGNETVDNEGKVKGDSDKTGDVATVMKTTAEGAGIGAIAAQSGRGAGIGAGIGAAVGIAAVLLSRGPEAELPRGTSLDVVLDRPVFLDADKDKFDTPGQASTLAGPPNREHDRNKIPF
jgi:type IV secretion system protein VirB10